MMSWIATDFFARSPVLLGPVIALALFFTVFVGAAARALLTRRAVVDRAARIPFENDEVGHD